MKYNKIMTRDSLEIIMNRLNGCRSLVAMLYEVSGTSTIPGDALSGICDLLDTICRDFQADIDAAENYTGKGAVSMDEAHTHSQSEDERAEQIMSIIRLLNIADAKELGRIYHFALHLVRGSEP